MFWPGVYDAFDLGVWYIPIAVFIIVACSNAVNFTDGLDGLAGLISATAFAAYGGIAILQGQDFIGRFCFTMVGALFGFLWFNVHPAELFMGDSGSLSIGATLGVIALMTGQWLLIPWSPSSRLAKLPVWFSRSSTFVSQKENACLKWHLYTTILNFADGAKHRSSSDSGWYL
jgi:UDP-N-acetylmuramyl pentapeptide phosphotransferase/UDP-N-acetylglucosamine-1-phosphate transferase